MSARPPWYRGLTGCLQALPRSADDLDVEAGELEVGELRPRAFLALATTLSPPQRVALATLSLAELAVWPQVDPEVAPAIARALEGGGSPPSPGAPRDGDAEPAATATRAACVLAARIVPALASGAAPLAITWEELRRTVQGVLRRHPRPLAATEQWLRRVVPQAALLAPEAARHAALEALAAPLSVPARWTFAVTSYDAKDGATVGVVDPAFPRRWVKELAHFSPYGLADRRLSTEVHVRVPLDPYRLGYLFQSLYVEDATDDAELGRYDVAVCREAASGVVVSFPGL